MGQRARVRQVSPEVPALTRRSDFGPIHYHAGPVILICKMGIVDPPNQWEGSEG